MHKFAAGGLIVAATIGAYHFSGPYRLAYDLHAAIKNRDAELLEHVVDFPAIRSQFKQAMVEDVSKEIVDNPFTVLALSFIDVLVNKLVTPEVFLGMISGQLGGDFGRMSAERLIFSIRWTSLSSACLLAHVEGSDCELRLSTSGFDNWKLGIDSAAVKRRLAAADR